MSKGQGKKIGIKFTQPLVGDVVGLSPPLGETGYTTPKGKMSASDSYTTSYLPETLIDGNTGTQWYTMLAPPQWFQIDLGSPKKIKGFRWYIGSSYRPSTFKVEGSNNGSSWTEVYTDTSDNTTGWKDFEFDNYTDAFRYFRWTVTGRHSTYIYIYELEINFGVGNEGAFTVSGKQYQWVDGPSYNGPLLNTDYPVKSVSVHPTEENSILLEFYDYEEFNNVEGKLGVIYDATKGSLTGTGGFVEGFVKSFTPSELEQTPNIGVHELLTIGPTELELTLTDVVYVDAFDSSDLDVNSITIAPVTLSLDLEDVDIENP